MAPVTAIPATSMLDSVNATLRSAGASAATQSPSATGGVDFANMITQGLDQVQGLQKTSDDLAVQAATGDLTDVHDYMIAATQAQVATEITVALRNKAVEAFSEIMRMQA